MQNEMSPVYKMKLIENIENVILKQYDCQKLETYFKLNQVEDSLLSGVFDFEIHYDVNDVVDINETLGSIAKSAPEKLIKMAIDLGIETPDFIPSIPLFRNVLQVNYKNASTSFEKAFQNVEKDPAEAIGNANSVLESIIKEVLNDDRFNDIDASKLTSGKLVKEILKKFELNMDSSDIPSEIKTMSNSLVNISKAIEDLRSDKTLHHGQDSNKYLIDQPLYGYFVVNACSTVGLFLINFYQNKFPKKEPYPWED